VGFAEVSISRNRMILELRKIIFTSCQNQLRIRLTGCWEAIVAEFDTPSVLFSVLSSFGCLVGSMGLEG
jgi:hypothetical protein